MPMKRGVIIVIVTIAVLPSTIYGRDVYKCVDPDGSVTYSDAPCARTLDEMEELTLFVWSPPEPVGLRVESRTLQNQDSAKIEREYAEYRETRSALVEKRNRLIEDFQRRGFSQTLSQMYERRSRIDSMRREIEHLDQMWKERLNVLGMGR